MYGINKTTYLPIYYMARGANLTSDQVDALFGELKMGITLKTWLFPVGLGLGLLMVALTVFLIYRY